MQRVWPLTACRGGETDLLNISCVEEGGGAGHLLPSIVTVPGRGYQFVAGVSEVWPSRTEGKARERPPILVTLTRRGHGQEKTVEQKGGTGRKEATREGSGPATTTRQEAWPRNRLFPAWQQGYLRQLPRWWRWLR